MATKALPRPDPSGTLRKMFAFFAENEGEGGNIGVFANTLWKQGWLPVAGDNPRPHLLAMLNADANRFRDVIAPRAWDYFVNKLCYVFGEEALAILLTDGLSKSTSAFLDDVLHQTEPNLAMEIMNTLELAGYDVDDPRVLARLYDELVETVEPAMAPRP